MLWPQTRLDLSRFGIALYGLWPSKATREAANSAEEAARRLLNLVNLRGATDNATIVVILSLIHI